MALRNTKNNSFNPIILDKSQLLDGKKIGNKTSVEETEKNYFIYESGI